MRVLVCQVYAVAIHSTKADQTLGRGKGSGEQVLLCGVHFPQFSTEAGGCTEEDKSRWLKPQNVLDESPPCQQGEAAETVLGVAEDRIPKDTPPPEPAQNSSLRVSGMAQPRSALGQTRPSISCLSQGSLCFLRWSLLRLSQPCWHQATQGLVIL